MKEMDINKISIDKLKETIYDSLPEDSLFGESFKVDRNLNKIDKEQFLSTIQIDSLNNALVIHNIEKFIDNHFINKILADLKYKNLTNDPKFDYNIIGTPETNITFDYKSPIIIANSEHTLVKMKRIVKEWQWYNDVEKLYNRAKKASNKELKEITTLSQFNKEFIFDFNNYKTLDDDKKYNENYMKMSVYATALPEQRKWYDAAEQENATQDKLKSLKEKTKFGDYSHKQFKLDLENEFPNAILCKDGITYFAVEFPDLASKDPQLNAKTYYSQQSKFSLERETYKFNCNPNPKIKIYQSYEVIAEKTTSGSYYIDIQKQEELKEKFKLNELPQNYVIQKTFEFYCEGTLKELQNDEMFKNFEIKENPQKKEIIHANQQDFENINFQSKNDIQTKEQLNKMINNINMVAEGISKTYLDIDKNIKDFEKKKGILLPEAKERIAKNILVDINKIKKQNAHYSTLEGAEHYKSKIDKFMHENQKIINNIENFKDKYQAKSKANTR